MHEQHQWSSKIRFSLTFWCTSFIVLCKKNDYGLANSRLQTKLKLILNGANYAELKINELNSSLTEIILTDINYRANKSIKLNISDKKKVSACGVRTADFTIYVFYIVLGLSYGIEVKPAVWETCFVFLPFLIWLNCSQRIAGFLRPRETTQCFVTPGSVLCVTLLSILSSSGTMDMSPPVQLPTKKKTRLGPGQCPVCGYETFGPDGGRGDGD